MTIVAFSISVKTVAAEVAVEKKVCNIWQQVKNAYQVAIEYEDYGEVETVYFDKNKIIDKEIVIFSTKLDRKENLLAIKWEQIDRVLGDTKYYIASSNGKVAWNFGDEIDQTGKNINDVLGNARGISHTLTGRVPVLLLGRSSENGCTKENNKFTVRELASNNNEIKFNITFQDRTEETHWVDQKNRLIKRIEWWDAVNSTRIRTTIRYNVMQYRIRKSN